MKMMLTAKDLRHLSASILLVLALVPLPCRGEEDAPTQAARELADSPKEPAGAPVEATMDGIWVPRQDSDTGGRIGIAEGKVKVGYTRPVSATLSLTPELSYSRMGIDASDIARLPDALHALSLGLKADYRWSPQLAFSFLVSPGLSGDFEEIGGSDLRFRFGLTGRYKSSDKLTFLAGLIYQEGYRSLPVFPILGAIYRPHERWTISIAAPRPGVTYSHDKNLRLFAGSEFFGGEYRLHDPALGAKVIRYRDFRLVAGADFTVASALKGEVAAGYAFSREFVFYDVFDAARSDVKVDPGPFVRAGLKTEW